MKSIIVLGIGLLLMACSHGLQEQGFAVPNHTYSYYDSLEGLKTEYDYHYIVTRDLVSSRWSVNQPHLTGPFHCTEKISSVEMAELRKDGSDHTWYRGCTPLADMPQHKYVLTADQSNASLAQGPISAAILAGGVAYAGHQIGRGLKGSGDNVQQNGGGASSSSDSEASAESTSRASSMHNSNNRTLNIKPTTKINSDNVIKVK